MDHTSGPPLQTRGNPCDYSRVYWCTCTLSSNPVHVAHVTGDAAPGLRGPGNNVVPHRKGSSTHKKPPTGNSRGQPIQAAAPFPRKDVSAPCRAGSLARGTYPLSAPSQGLAPQWLSWRLWVLVSDFLTHAIPSPSEMLDRNPTQRRFSTHLHADGILTGVRQGITRTNTTNGTNAAIATPDKGSW